MSGTVSPAAKRVLQELRELSRDPSDQFDAAPLPNDLLEWHFTIHGPSDTPFAGGRYHGRIILPPDYPFKPPNIVLLTPNGRWEVGKKICLSVSAHHPELWQPAWGIRTILSALISFMTTPADGALHAIDYPDEERVSLAKKSLSYTCPKCNVCMKDVEKRVSEKPAVERSNPILDAMKNSVPIPAKSDAPLSPSQETTSLSPQETAPLSLSPQQTSSLPPQEAAPLSLSSQQASVSLSPAPVSLSQNETSSLSPAPASLSQAKRESVNMGASSSSPAVDAKSSAEAEALAEEHARKAREAMEKANHRMGVSPVLSERMKIMREKMINEKEKEREKSIENNVNNNNNSENYSENNNNNNNNQIENQNNENQNQNQNQNNNQNQNQNQIINENQNVNNNNNNNNEEILFNFNHQNNDEDLPKAFDFDDILLIFFILINLSLLGFLVSRKLAL